MKPLNYGVVMDVFMIILKNFLKHVTNGILKKDPFGKGLHTIEIRRFAVAASSKDHAMNMPLCHTYMPESTSRCVAKVQACGRS